MEKFKTVAIPADTTVKLLDPNPSRTGYKVENLTNSSPAVTVGVRNYREIGASDVAEVQRLAFAQTPGAGTFKIGIPGGQYKTTDLAYNASAATIQTAMRLLPGFGSVTVARTSTGPIDVTLTGVFPAPKLKIFDNAIKTAGAAAVMALNLSGTPTAGELQLNFKAIDGEFKNYSRDQITKPLVPADLVDNALQSYLRGFLGDSGLTVAASVITFSSVGKKVLAEVFANKLKILNDVEVQNLLFDNTPASGTFKLKTGLGFLEAEIAAVAAEAVIDVTNDITLTAAEAGSLFNAKSVTLEVKAAAANPTNTVLISFIADGDEIVIEVTPNDGTNNSATPVTVTTANLVELINTGLITGKFPTITDEDDLRELFTAAGGGAQVLADSLNQTVNFTGGLDAWDGEEIPFDVSAAQLQTSIRTQDGSSSVTVTGDADNGFVFTFTGMKNVHQMKVIDNQILDGSSELIELTVETDTPFLEDPVTCAPSFSTVGVDQVAIDITQSITTPGSSTTYGKSDVAQAATLTSSDKSMKGAVYVRAAAVASVKVTEIFD